MSSRPGHGQDCATRDGRWWCSGQVRVRGGDRSGEPAQGRVCVVAQPNVAFSCWRGLASSVKARQRLYRRKMQGRASPLQRDVRMALFFCFSWLRCCSLGSSLTGRPAVVYRRCEDRRRRPQVLPVPSVVHDLGAEEVGLTAVLKPGVSLTCGCDVEEAGPELVLKRRNTSNRRAVL